MPFQAHICDMKLPIVLLFPALGHVTMAAVVPRNPKDGISCAAEIDAERGCDVQQRERCVGRPELGDRKPGLGLRADLPREPGFGLRSVKTDDDGRPAWACEEGSLEKPVVRCDDILHV